MPTSAITRWPQPCWEPTTWIPTISTPNARRTPVEQTARRPAHTLQLLERPHPGKVKEILRIAPATTSSSSTRPSMACWPRNSKKPATKAPSSPISTTSKASTTKPTSPQDALRRLLLKCVWHNDAYACQYADKVVCLNERDSRKLQEIYGRKADFITPSP